MQIQTTLISFPSIRIKTRDAQKLRGFFGNMFKDYSPLLHNHYQTGGLRYKYPLVQYKVLQGVPTLVALEEGAELLTSLFLKVRTLDLGDVSYEIQNKNIQHFQSGVGFSNELHQYRFETMWMGLNQNNYQLYMKQAPVEKEKFLNRILIGNLLSLFKGLDMRLLAHERVMVKVNLSEAKTTFKDQKMLAFKGDFVANVQLPSFIGLGKAVSRGFGTIALSS